MLVAANVNNCRAKIELTRSATSSAVFIRSSCPISVWYNGVFKWLRVSTTQLRTCWVPFSVLPGCASCRSSPVNVIYLKISPCRPDAEKGRLPPHNAPRFDERDGAPLHGTATAVCHVYWSEPGLHARLPPPHAVFTAFTHANKRKTTPRSTPGFSFIKETSPNAARSL